MLIGLIADVHSNVFALESVLSDMDALGVEKILHAGDIVGYNPYPNETIGLFKKRRIISIRGNHERALVTEIHQDSIHMLQQLLNGQER